MSHTRAPWFARPSEEGKEWEVVTIHGQWSICLLAGEPGNGTAQDNARLIAAAPIMREALLDLFNSEYFAGLPPHKQVKITEALLAVTSD